MELPADRLTCDTLELTMSIADLSDFDATTPWKELRIPAAGVPLSEFTTECHFLFELPDGKIISKLFFRNQAEEADRMEILSDIQWEYVLWFAAHSNDFIIELLVRDVENHGMSVLGNDIRRFMVGDALTMLIPLEEERNYPDLECEFAHAFQRASVQPR